MNAQLWMHQPKWFHSDCDIKFCDFALFIKHDSTIDIRTIACNYQNGMVNEILPSQDGFIWKFVFK